MIAGRQVGYERRDVAAVAVNHDDTGTVVLASCMCRLIGVGHKEASTLQSLFERYVHRGSCRLQPIAVGGRLCQWTADQLA
jgi:hypothetical protein